MPPRTCTYSFPDIPRFFHSRDVFGICSLLVFSRSPFFSRDYLPRCRNLARGHAPHIFHGRFHKYFMNDYEYRFCSIALCLDSFVFDLYARKKRYFIASWCRIGIKVKFKRIKMRGEIKMIRVKVMSREQFRFERIFCGKKRFWFNDFNIN